MSSMSQPVGFATEIGAESAIWTLVGVDRAAEEVTGEEWSGGDWDAHVNRAADFLAQLSRSCTVAYPGLPENFPEHLVSLLGMYEQTRTLRFSQAFAFQNDLDNRRDDVVVWWRRELRDKMNETVLRSAPRCVLSFADREA